MTVFKVCPHIRHAPIDRSRSNVHDKHNLKVSFVNRYKLKIVNNVSPHVLKKRSLCVDRSTITIIRCFARCQPKIDALNRRICVSRSPNRSTITITTVSVVSAHMSSSYYMILGQNRCGQVGGNLVFVKTTNFEIHFYDHTSSVEAQESFCLQKCLDSLNTFCRSVEFSPADKTCIVSDEDTFSRADQQGEPQLAGKDYYEPICVAGECLSLSTTILYVHYCSRSQLVDMSTAGGIRTIHRRCNRRSTDCDRTKCHRCRLHIVMLSKSQL